MEKDKQSLIIANAQNKGFAHVLILLLIIIVAGLFYFLYSPKSEDFTEKILPKPTSMPAPTPYQFPYKNPNIPKNGSYRIIIVGDSIINSLGLNANVLRKRLISLYPNSEFVTYSKSRKPRT